MIEDLTMLATLPVCEDETAAKAQAEADKAAAAETMPPPKEQRAPQQDDPPEQEGSGEEDRG